MQRDPVFLPGSDFLGRIGGFAVDEGVTDSFLQLF